MSSDLQLEELVAGELAAFAATAARLVLAAGPELAEAARRSIDTIERGGTIFLAGNGGSAADSAHIANEFVSKYMVRRRPFAALALGVNPAISTACANDGEYDRIFSRQLHAFARPGDLLVCMTTSGESQNLREAAVCARERQMGVIAMVGKEQRKLAGLCDLYLSSGTDNVARTQEAHLFFGHVMCCAAESWFSGRQE